MFLLVLITGAVGWLCSYVLLSQGLHNMVFRYPASLCVAYLSFMGLLWLWLKTQASDYNAFTDVPDLVMGSAKPIELPHVFKSGQGGDFAGAGATSSFDDVSSPNLSGVDLSSNTGASDAMTDAVVIGDAGEAAIPLFLILAAIGVVFSSLYVVYIAPTLFAELLLDGVLSASLYRHLRRTNQRHWLSTALRSTAIPFIVTFVVLVVLALVLNTLAPGAQTLSQALLF
jgi:hypothetical protein